MSDGADVTEQLRSEVGRLTAVPASAFVAERTARVRELKAAGERELAGVLASQRRPTVPAWAVDQLAHHHAAALEALFAAADAVRSAQSAATPDRAAVRAATTGFSTQVRALRSLASDALTGAGIEPGTHLDDVEATLLAAATDDDIAADVRAGALLRPAPSPGFAALASIAPPGRPVSPREEPEPPVETEDEAGTGTEAEREALRARREELEQQHAAQEAAARDAAVAEDEARQRAAEHRAEADRALAAADAADGQAASAAQTVRDRQEALARLAEEIAAVDEALAASD